jgi:hypothetical protein
MTLKAAAKESNAVQVKVKSQNIVGEQLRKTSSRCALSPATLHIRYPPFREV